MVEKPIKSVEELATVAQREFLSIGERFGGLEERAGAVEKKVDCRIQGGNRFTRPNASGPPRHLRSAWAARKDRGLSGGDGPSPR